MDCNLFWLLILSAPTELIRQSDMSKLGKEIICRRQNLTPTTQTASKQPTDVLSRADKYHRTYGYGRKSWERTMEDITEYTRTVYLCMCVSACAAHVCAQAPMVFSNSFHNSSK